MPPSNKRLSIIIPACNEAERLPGCLRALIRSVPPHIFTDVVVVSNGSDDGTARVAQGFADAFAAKGWDFSVLELPPVGKLAALNAGDQAAKGGIRAYIDADVVVSGMLISGLARIVDRPEAAFASGKVQIQGCSAVSRAYARFWRRLPFMTTGVPGCGLFAVNAAGRARWGEWPRIVADDLYARLHFAPAERHLVPEPYEWPVAEGLSALTRVRRRQDYGVAEIGRLFPHLMANEDKPALSRPASAALALRDLPAFMVYAGVALAVRARRSNGDWSRARS